MTLIRIKSNQRGFSLHYILPILFILLVTLIGVRVLTYSRAAPSSPSTTPPAYATIIFGRSGWLPEINCQPIPGSPSLEDVISWMHKQGVPATTGVVIDYTQPTTELCDKKYITYPSWADLTRLQSLYATTIISQGVDYDAWSSYTTAAQYQADSCGSLPTFVSNGFTRAWGLFNYPNNDQNPIAQQAVDSCFAFGRSYGTGFTTQAQAIVPPYGIKTLSVTSGQCNDPTQPCYTAPIASNKRYMMPNSVIPLLNPSSGEYSIVQFYRFVTGANSTGTVTWDCTNPNPKEHWVSTAELYCYNDFHTIILKRGANVVMTDPTTVAQAWGRIPPGQ